MLILTNHGSVINSSLKKIQNMIYHAGSIILCDIEEDERKYGPNRDIVYGSTHFTKSIGCVWAIFFTWAT